MRTGHVVYRVRVPVFFFREAGLQHRPIRLGMYRKVEERVFATTYPKVSQAKEPSSVMNSGCGCNCTVDVGER